MKKKVLIVIVIILVIIGVLVGLYFNGLRSVSNKSNVKDFKINTGDSKVMIINNLKEEGLIRSKLSLYIYVYLNDYNLKAGTYELNTNMNAKAILNTLDEGKSKSNDNTYKITFIEGKRLVDYAKLIASNTNTTTEEVLKVMSDEAYLKELINKYWFLTEDILNSNIYYPLEGYLYANTYEFYHTDTVKDILNKILAETAKNLEEYKDSFTSSNYSIHEIMTMASIVESEGANSTDRQGVAGVFYNRLNSNWPLGSDVTAYYGVHKDFTNEILQSELDACNPYNTRGVCAIKGLPVGPISMPSKSSIEAALNPTVNDYFFFVADINKKTYFSKTNSEHEQIVNELKSNGLWYEY